MAVKRITRYTPVKITKIAPKSTSIIPVAYASPGSGAAEAYNQEQQAKVQQHFIEQKQANFVKTHPSTQTRTTRTYKPPTIVSSPPKPTTQKFKDTAVIKTFGYEAPKRNTKSTVYVNKSSINIKNILPKEQLAYGAKPQNTFFNTKIETKDTQSIYPWEDKKANTTPFNDAQILYNDNPMAKPKPSTSQDLQERQDATSNTQQREYEKGQIAMGIPSNANTVVGTKKEQALAQQKKDREANKKKSVKGAELLKSKDDFDFGGVNSSLGYSKAWESGKDGNVGKVVKTKIIANPYGDYFKKSGNVKSHKGNPDGMGMFANEYFGFEDPTKKSSKK